MEELEKEKKYVDVQVCPKCKSPLVRRVGSMAGDISGHMGLTPPKYECRECGWRERLVLKATNRPTSSKDVVIMAEAKDAENQRKNKDNKGRQFKFHNALARAHRILQQKEGIAPSIRSRFAKKN